MTDSPTLEALKQEADATRIQAEATGAKVFVLVAAIRPAPDNPNGRHVEFVNSTSAATEPMDAIAWLQMLDAERARVMTQMGLRP